MDYKMSRLRYFNGQFLLEKDFTDQQEYHINQSSLHGRMLHVWGITEGLAVLPGSVSTKVNVLPGAAVSKAGQLILLDQATEAEAEDANGQSVVVGQDYYLLIVFNEVPDAMAGGQYVAGNTRYTQKPRLYLVPVTGLGVGEVVLARLHVGPGGVFSNIDPTYRTYAGSRLPANGDKTFDLRPRPDGTGDTKLSIERFTAGNPTPDMLLTVRSSGFVGIGDTAPLQRLIVSGGNVGVGYNTAGQTARLAVNGAVGIGVTDTGTYELKVSGDSQVTGVAAVGTGVSKGNLTTGAITIGDTTKSFGGGTGWSTNVAAVLLETAEDTEIAVHDSSTRLTSLMHYSGNIDNRITIGRDMGWGVTPNITVHGVQSGTANDYTKAQFTLNGGGTVTWSGGRLKWSARLIAIAHGKTTAIPSGHISIPMPPLGTSFSGPNGTTLTTDLNGFPLDNWQALYAVHTFGGNQSAIEFRIRHYNETFEAPSNWILLAIYNGDDDTIKLGTGTVISSGSSVAHGSAVPRGVIVMWSGAQNAIPAGWALCNGTNGTPDLRNRFVVGAGSGGAYAPGNTGGADTVALDWNQMPVHNHGAYVDYDGWHNHYMSVDTGGGIEGYYGGDMIKTDHDKQYSVWANYLVETHYDGWHSHAIGVYNAGGGGAHENRPPYYALCYIMKL